MGREINGGGREGKKERREIGFCGGWKKRETDDLCDGQFLDASPSLVSPSTVTELTPPLGHTHGLTGGLF